MVVVARQAEVEDILAGLESEAGPDVRHCPPRHCSVRRDLREGKSGLTCVTVHSDTVRRDLREGKSGLTSVTVHSDTVRRDLREGKSGLMSVTVHSDTVRRDLREGKSGLSNNCGLSELRTVGLGGTELFFSMTAFIVLVAVTFWLALAVCNEQ